MEALRFLVQGSAEKPYEVVIRKEGRNLSATCTCQMGNKGVFCRHRFRILSGDAQGVVSHNEAQVDVAADWMWGSDVVDAMEVMAAAEINLELAQKSFSKAKDSLADALST